LDDTTFPGPATVAVNVTGLPDCDGFGADVKATVVAAEASAFRAKTCRTAHTDRKEMTRVLVVCIEVVRRFS
jgi:hypothetical protein